MVRSDFQIWFSPGFPMQSKQARSDPSRCIVRQNSSSALTLLWLFFHLHLLVFFSTSLQDYWWNWNGWCWTNSKDDSIDHVWNFPLSKMYANWFLVSTYLIWILGSKLILSNNQSRATLWVKVTSLIVRLLPFIIILITASLSSNTHNKASWWEELTFEGVKSTLSKSLITPWDCFRFWIVWSVERTSRLFNNGSFRSIRFWVVFQKLKRSIHTNQVRVFRPIPIQHPKKWSLILLNCARLKFVSCTSNWLAQTYGKCTMFQLK